MNIFKKEWWLYNSPIYIDLGIHKLYKDLFKVRKKIIDKPYLKFYKGDCGTDIVCDYYMDIYSSFNSFKNKLFAIHVEPLGYKYKWGYFVYTYRPEIVCIFNKRIIFTIRLKEPNNCYEHEYWQKIVDDIIKK